MTDWQIITGDCLDVMAEMEPGSIDAVVTDPPYGLEFMGKDWDRGVPGVKFWIEALRVLKPGGHLLAFGGTRTHHRLWCAIEDAGFEIRDTLSWLYGSGFPKSLDVGKAIDKAGGVSPEKQSQVLRTARERSGMSRDDVATAIGCTSSSVRDWEEGRARAVGRSVEFITPSPQYRELLAELLGYTSDERTIAGVGGGPRSLYETGHRGISYGPTSTDAARQWDGFGTALKPAWEPVCMARKPLAGTVAANVIEHGTGAINVDGCRVGVSDGDKKGEGGGCTLGEGRNRSSAFAMGAGDPLDGKGRWPANVALDEHAAAMLDEQSGERGGGAYPASGARFGYSGGERKQRGTRTEMDTGGASRFFYSAKASRAERNAGLGGGPPVVQMGARPRDNEHADWERRNFNHHPTVKPVALMRWLVRLVTPPGGLVLDPFAGSGSTGVACGDEGFNFVGIELEPQYAAIARQRLIDAYQQQRLDLGT